MALNPMISLAIQGPEIEDPLVQQSKALAIRNAMQTGQLTAEKLKSEQLANQQTQQAVSDDKAARSFFSQNPNATDEQMISTLGPKVAHPIIQERYKSQESQLKMAGEKADLFGRIAGSIKDEASFHVGVQSALQSGLIKPEEASTLHQQGWTPQTQALIAQHATEGLKAKDQIDTALAQLKDRREQAEEDRKAAMAPAQQAKATADATIAQQTATGQKPIQPEEQARLDLSKRAEERIANHDAATERNATALLKVAQGRLGLEGQHAEIAKNIYEQTYGEGANPALVGVEPKLRAKAAGEAQKYAEEWTKASESAANMKTIIDLARSGNKVAYAYAPTTGVLSINTASGVKRVNMAEIKSYGGAGSAADAVEGWLGKQISGASIPKNILDNMEQLHRQIADNSSKKYDASLDSLNQNYRSSFKRVGGAAGGKTATMAQIREYATTHKVTEAEARKQAESEGFVIK